MPLIKSAADGRSQPKEVRGHCKCRWPKILGNPFYHIFTSARSSSLVVLDDSAISGNPKHLLVLDTPQTLVPYSAVFSSCSPNLSFKLSTTRRPSSTISPLSGVPHVDLFPPTRHPLPLDILRSYFRIPEVCTLNV